MQLIIQMPPIGNKKLHQPLKVDAILSCFFPLLIKIVCHGDDLCQISFLKTKV